MVLFNWDGSNDAYRYNHGGGSGAELVQPIPDILPAMTFMQGGTPEGTVMTWGDGHAKYVYFNELVDVGQIHRSRSDSRQFSLPPGESGN